LIALLQSVGNAIVPWIPLIGWVVFWMFAVNWRKFKTVILQGAWAGLVLIGLIWILVWGTISPPQSGAHHIFGLTLSNYVDKLVYVSMLFCMMFLCGAAQLSGFCASYMRFANDEEENSATDRH